MSRAELCGAKGAVFGGLIPVADTGFQKKIDRMQPTVAITIAGKSIGTETYLSDLQSVMVEETTGFLMNMARVVFANPKSLLTDDATFEEQVEMTVEMGYRGVGTERIGGKFLIENPRFVFSGQQRLELIGYGEEIKLGRTEKRRKFDGMRDSQIAEKIADENGFEADVQRTDVVHDRVLQASESDYQFLSKRAKLHGFQLYVEDGILHFHSARVRDRGVQLLYREDGRNMVTGVTVETVPSLLRGAQFEATQIDPLDLDVIDVRSSDEPDELSQGLMSGVKNPRKWSEIAAVDGKQPVRFLVNEGHEQKRGQIQAQADAFSEATRWLIKATGAVPGIVGLHANDVVELIGIGRHSGKYVVTKAVHQLLKGYETTFELMRSFTGPTQGDQSDAVAVAPVSAGTVILR